MDYETEELRMGMIFDMKRISKVNVCAQLKGTKERLNGIEAYRV